MKDGVEEEGPTCTEETVTRARGDGLDGDLVFGEGV